MKLFLAIFLIFSFAGVAVFGLWAMDNGGDHSHGGCIAAAIQGIDCPREGGVLSFVAFHLDVFKNFSLAILNGVFVGFLSLLAVLIVISVFSAGVDSTLPGFAINHQRNFSESAAFPFQREFVRWLAFHKNSPSFT